MVDWAKLNMNLSYVSDGLQFGLDLMNPRKTGESLGDKVSTAGINLFGNSLATQNAAELRRATGSNMGYFAKSQAGDNAAQAVKNTTMTSLFYAQLGQLFGGPRYMHHPMGMWDTMSNPYMGYDYNPGAYKMPGFDVFDNSFFRNNYWMG